MYKRVRLFDFSNTLQATAVKKNSDKENDCIEISVYGWTPCGNAYVNFKYQLEYPDTTKRDLDFESMECEKLHEDVNHIIKTMRVELL